VLSPGMPPRGLGQTVLAVPLWTGAERDRAFLDRSRGYAPTAATRPRVSPCPGRVASGGVCAARRLRQQATRSDRGASGRAAWHLVLTLTGRSRVGVRRAPRSGRGLWMGRIFRAGITESNTCAYWHPPSWNSNAARGGGIMLLTAPPWGVEASGLGCHRPWSNAPPGI
jgi:hypothetical protein